MKGKLILSTSLIVALALGFGFYYVRVYQTDDNEHMSDFHKEAHFV